MSAGLSDKLNILQQSPHDFFPPLEEAKANGGASRWIPSRYNVRATTGDGRLVLWNSYRGTMNVFAAKQRLAIEALLSKKGFAAKREGIVKYLLDRGFLVPEGTDEFRRIQLGFGRQHYRTDRLELFLLSSEDCNFRCEYCYEDFARGTMLPSVREGVKKLVEKQLGSLRSLLISWFGGEPLYGFQAIEDLAPYFVKLVDEHDLHYFSNMTTNGYLLTPEVADKLLAWRVTKYQITLDGPPETHNRNRPTRDGQGSFDKILDNLKSLSGRPDDFAVDLRVNFDRNNYPHMDKFLDIVEQELSSDPRFRLRFRAIGRWGGPNDPQLEVCGAEESKLVQMELRNEARRRGLNVSDDLREIKGMGAQVCYAARPYNFIIGASGKVMKCTIDLDKEDRNVVGHLGEDGEVELDQDKMALWTEPAFEKDTKCQKCVVLPTCQGVFCPLVRIESGKSPCTPLRMNVKQELRGVVEDGEAPGRSVLVGAVANAKQEPLSRQAAQ